MMTPIQVVRRVLDTVVVALTIDAPPAAAAGGVDASDALWMSMWACSGPALTAMRCALLSVSRVDVEALLAAWIAAHALESIQKMCQSFIHDRYRRVTGVKVSASPAGKESWAMGDKPGLTECANAAASWIVDCAAAMPPPCNVSLTLTQLAEWCASVDAEVEALLPSTAKAATPRGKKISNIISGAKRGRQTEAAAAQPQVPKVDVLVGSFIAPGDASPGAVASPSVPIDSVLLSPAAVQWGVVDRAAPTQLKDAASLCSLVHLATVAAFKEGDRSAAFLTFVAFDGKPKAPRFLFEHQQAAIHDFTEAGGDLLIGGSWAVSAAAVAPTD